MRRTRSTDRPAATARQEKVNDPRLQCESFITSRRERVKRQPAGPGATGPCPPEGSSGSLSRLHHVILTQESPKFRRPRRRATAGREGHWRLGLCFGSGVSWGGSRLPRPWRCRYLRLPPRPGGYLEMSLGPRILGSFSPTQAGHGVDSSSIRWFRSRRVRNSFNAMGTLSGGWMSATDDRAHRFRPAPAPPHSISRQFGKPFRISLVAARGSNASGSNGPLHSR